MGSKINFLILNGLVILSTLLEVSFAQTQCNYYPDYTRYPNKTVAVSCSYSCCPGTPLSSDQACCFEAWKILTIFFSIVGVSLIILIAVFIWSIKRYIKKCFKNVPCCAKCFSAKEDDDSLDPTKGDDFKRIASSINEYLVSESAENIDRLNLPTYPEPLQRSQLKHIKDFYKTVNPTNKVQDRNVAPINPIPKIQAISPKN